MLRSENGRRDLLLVRILGGKEKKNYSKVSIFGLNHRINEPIALILFARKKSDVKLDGFKHPEYYMYLHKTIRLEGKRLGLAIVVVI